MSFSDLPPMSAGPHTLTSCSWPIRVAQTDPLYLPPRSLRASLKVRRLCAGRVSGVGALASSSVFWARVAPRVHANVVPCLCEPLLDGGDHLAPLELLSYLLNVALLLLRHPPGYRMVDARHPAYCWIWCIAVDVPISQISLLLLLVFIVVLFHGRCICCGLVSCCCCGLFDALQHRATSP